MRLISQHGNVDIPYENVILFHANNDVKAGNNTIDSMTMGHYSSGEKAYKVMEMVRKKYLETTINVSTSISNGKTLARAVVFQFPSDDEVEV